MQSKDIIFSKYKNQIFTIPNLLSFLRICLIPIIAWIYLDMRNYQLTGILLIISALTDILDGMIARRFNMISDLGKILDPIADKATQAVVAILLATRFPLLILLVCLGIIKEGFLAISGYLVIKKRGVVLGAGWHGKLNTVAIISTMALHLLWENITPTISAVTITLCLALTTLSMILYAARNFDYIFRIK